MKVDFSQTINSLDGQPLMGPGNVTVTLGLIAVNAILEGEKSMPTNEKVRRYDLAMAIHAAKGPLELLEADLDMIRKAVEEHPSPLVVGQASRMLQI